MAVSHIFTNPVADGPITSIVRPSDWNSGHYQYLTVDGNTAGQSTFSGSNIVIGGGPNITISGVNATRFDISAGAGDGFNRLAAGTQTAGTNATVAFANSNGITFGMSDSSQITASHNGLTSQSNQAFSAAGGSSAFQTLTFNNANGVSFSNNGGAVEASVATSLTNIRLSAGTASNLLSAVTFANGNGVSFGLDASTITASIATSLTAMRLSAGTTSNLLSAVTFANSNGISFGLDASTVTASHNALTSQSNQNVTAGNGGFAFQTLSFSNINGISFGTSAGSAITASHNALTTARASTDAIGLNTAQSNVTWTVNSAGLSFDARGYAGTGTTFNGANISGSMTVNSVGIQLSLSGATAAPSPVNFSAGTTSNDLGSVVFSNSNGVSFGLNGSTITGSVAAAGGVTLSGLDPYDNRMLVAMAGGQASLWINDLVLPAAVQFDRVGLRITHSNASNSSGSCTISVWIGVSTRNASTLSSLHSTSFTTGITQSGTVGSYSWYGGVKVLPVPWTTTITAGNYWVGIVTRTTTGGANMTFGNMVVSVPASTASGWFGSGSNATAALRVGAPGVYSATTAGMPAAISLTQINANSSAFHRPIVYQLLSNII